MAFAVSPHKPRVSNTPEQGLILNSTLCGTISAPQAGQILFEKKKVFLDQSKLQSVGWEATFVSVTVQCFPLVASAHREYRPLTVRLSSKLRLVTYMAYVTQVDICSASRKTERDLLLLGLAHVRDRRNPRRCLSCANLMTRNILFLLRSLCTIPGLRQAAWSST